MTDYEKEMLEKDIRKGFGLVESGRYEIGDLIVFHKSYAEKVAVRATVLGIVLGIVIGFIAGTLTTSLFNWIF